MLRLVLPTSTIASITEMPVIDMTASQNRAGAFHPGRQIAMARPMLGAYEDQPGTCMFGADKTR